MISRLMRYMVLVLIISFVLLMIGGWALDNVQDRTGYHDSFFRYRIRAFDDLPYWFAAVLALLAANGIWFVRLSRLVIRATWLRPNGSIEFPIHPGMLFGGNLLIDVALIVLFIVIRNLRL